MFKNILSAKSLFHLSILTVPIFISKKTYQCTFWSKKKTNNIQQRIFINQINSNKPCQDRYDYRQLKNINAYAAAVYDGHGGWQVSDLCKRVLLQYLDQCIQKNKSKFQNDEELIKASLTQAFKMTEEQFLNAARIGYKYGFGRFARTGSCVLVCVVHNNKVYTANAGDSLGLLVEQSAGLQRYTQINNELNANKPSQQQRMKKLFPLEQDIVICKKQGNTSCYVKGRLQPTRSIGDLRLKYPQFNNPLNIASQQDYQSPIKLFSGNYITWQPQIKVFQLNKNHRWIILATDGLWDQLQRQQVAQITKNKQAKLIPVCLISQALQKAATDKGMTLQQLEKIPKGKTRNIHDDITVVVFDLQNQYK